MTLKEQVLAHWRRMRDDAPGVHEKNRESPGERFCAFCAHYKETGESPCEGCPIMIATGADTCTVGPYLDAQNAWVEFKESGWDESQREWWQLKADAMIEFLEGLPNES